MDINYRHDVKPSAIQIAELYKSAGLPRPIDDLDRLEKMFNNSNLVITAWDDNTLVGVTRSITDWVWSCYLADLAVKHEYQKMGIGKQLLHLTKEKVGEQSMVLLLSVPSALAYCPKMGFIKQESSFIINRAEWR